MNLKFLLGGMFKSPGRLLFSLLHSLTAGQVKDEIRRVLTKRMTPDDRTKMAQRCEALAAALRSGNIDGAADALAQAIGDIKV